MTILLTGSANRLRFRSLDLVKNRRAWDILANAGLGVGFAVLLASSAVAIADSWGPTYWPFDVSAGLLAAIIALARRRHPSGTAVAALAVASAATVIAWAAGLPHEPGPAMALALAVLVSSAVATVAGWPAGAIAVAGLAVVAGTWIVVPASSGASGVAVINTAGWVAGVATGLTRRLLDARRRAVADRVRRDERLAMARELHDVVAHHITGIVVAAQAAQLVARKRPEQIDESLHGIEAAGSEALAAMRRIVGLLREADDAAPAAPGPEQLSELIRRFDEQGPPVRLSLPDGEAVWPPEVTNTVYRVVQESLTNISRHAAAARSVTVNVSNGRRGVTVEVVDDSPPGSARHHRGGYGLVGMRERVETLGGTLRVGPRPGAGWSVVATLPVPAQGSR
jgi:signal transduction histidine kinase